MRETSGLSEPRRSRPRRALWVFVVVVVSLAALGLWGWFVWFPGYRPALQPGERFGVDVSRHQGDIDWQRVGGDGIEFAYIKATEGKDFVDPSFEENWEGAGAAGLDRGAYHFFTLCRAGADQAENYLRTVPDDPEALPPAIDLELAGNCSERPDREWVHAQLIEFLDRVESATGTSAVLYVGEDFEDRYHLRGDLARAEWRRRILLRPEDERWWIWQFSGWGRVAGIEGDADLDVMRGTPAEDP